jgi:bacteriocin biosynthesis cyclodehydratase domain-containing protein
VRLKRHYSIVAHSADIVELRCGVWNPASFTLVDETDSGHLLGILERLDGRHSVEEIASEAGIPKSTIESLLEQLAAHDLLEQESTHALDYYLDRICPELVAHERKPSGQRSPVILFGDPVVSEQIANILSTSAASDRCNTVTADSALKTLLLKRGTSWLFDGFALEEESGPFSQWAGQLVLFPTANLNPIVMRAFNRVSLRYRIPWIHAAMDGPFLLIGPTFIPFRSPCYECLEARVLVNLKDAGSYQRYKRALADGRVSGVTVPLDSVLMAMLGSLTAFEAINFVLTGAAFTVGKMLSIHLPTMRFIFNDVLRLPGCPACGAAPERDESELFFDARVLMEKEE